MIRVILISCGEPSVDIAREALRCADGYGSEWEVVEVQGVTPMDAAFNEMLRAAAGPACYAYLQEAYKRIQGGDPVDAFLSGPQPEAEFHVQVDADMILKPEAITTLIARIRAERSKPGGAGCWQWCQPLWDDLFNRPIMGVKVYHTRSAVDVRLGGYRPVRHCETDLIERAQAIGLSQHGVHPIQESPSDPDVLGTHHCLDELTAYRNCFDRQLRARWRAARGLPDWFLWIRPHWQLFPRWFGLTGDPRYRAAYAGLVAGAAHPIPADDWGEADRSDPPGWETYQKWSHMGEVDWAVACYTPLGVIQRWKEVGSELR